MIQYATRECDKYRKECSKYDDLAARLNARGVEQISLRQYSQHDATDWIVFPKACGTKYLLLQ